MIVSEKYKFIYLKGHKVAGSSILMAAGRFCAEEDMVHRPAQGNPPTDTWSVEEWGKGRNTAGLGREAIPARIIAEVGESKWNDYFQFSAVRNP